MFVGWRDPIVHGWLDFPDSASIAILSAGSSQRIEAHTFVSFLAYCLHVTLGQWLRILVPGLTTRSLLEEFVAVHVVDVHVPASDGRTLILSRNTQPEPDLQLLLTRLKLELPAQPPPRITAAPGSQEVSL